MAHVLVVGSGGREHALAWKLAQSSRVRQISVAPGNAGIDWHPRTSTVDIDSTDIVSLLDYAEEQAVDTVVIGPENPLAAGLVDQFQAAGIRAFGPSRQAAMIEISKHFAKALMRQNGIPTPDYQIFNALDPAVEYLYEHPAEKLVIKANGLAQGKGVFLPLGQSDAEGILRSLLERDALGDAGREVVVEERLDAPEISVAAFTDGQAIGMMPAVQDYKPLHDHDAGPNTGGMGAYAPVPFVPDETLTRIQREIMEPVLAALRAAGTPFQGVLNAGIALTPSGPTVLELNARFGDPAAQVLLPLLETDLFTVIDACLTGTLDRLTLRWKSSVAVAVVLATAGYPEHNDPDLPVRIEPDTPPNTLIFQAGTRPGPDGVPLTTGGRIVSVTGLGETHNTAVSHAYEAVQHIHFENMHYRTDIGKLEPDIDIHPAS